MSMTDLFGPVISSYSRAQAVDDGVLVEIDASLAKQAGFIVPVALTSAVFADCIEWPMTESGIQDERGRSWDVLWMAHCAIHRTVKKTNGRNEPIEQVMFEVARVPRGGTRPAVVQLKVLIGPGDDGEPVITILQPHED
jgi:hypothetical protein